MKTLLLIAAVLLTVCCGCRWCGTDFETGAKWEGYEIRKVSGHE
jgi:hypothetical protein